MTRPIIRALVLGSLVPLILLSGRELDAQVQSADLTVALTFDDLVGQSTVHTTANYVDINTRILEALREADAPAIGFVNESKLYTDDGLVPERVGILRQWLAQGFELGNHTYSHPNLHEVPVDDWLADMDRGQTVLGELWTAFPPRRRYLRHPYLRTGRTTEVRERVAEHLEAREYTVAPVTIDNQEWIFARAYDVALDTGDESSAEAVVVAYLTYMDAMFSYYEEQSTRILGRQLPQVLLLHANRLNATALPELIEVIADRGYRFNELGEALRDPAFTRADGYFGPAGITWLHRWALADGMPGSTFAGEPPVPEFVQRLSGL